MQGLGNDFLVFDAPAAAARRAPRRGEAARPRRSAHRRRLRPGADARGAQRRAQPRVLPGVQFRRQRGGTMRQRRALRGRAAVCARARLGRELTHGEPGGSVHAQRARGWTGVGGHGHAEFRSARAADAGAALRRPAIRWTSTARTWSSARCRWAIRTSCCGCRTSRPRRSRAWGPPSSAIRASRGVNVGFMQIVNRGSIRLRVFERGAGETRACGTGACAAVAVGGKRGCWMRTSGGAAGRHGPGLVAGPGPAAVADGTRGGGVQRDRSTFEFG